MHNSLNCDNTTYTIAYTITDTYSAKIILILNDLFQYNISVYIYLVI